MSYDFSKLSRVPINESVTDGTYTLVVNQDEVEKTPYALVVDNIKDYTTEYNSYASENPGTSPIDFIRTLSPIQNGQNATIREGHITYSYFYYEFKVFVDTNSTWYKIIEVNKNKQILTEYLYNPQNMVECVSKRYNGINSDSGTYFITPIGFEDVRVFNCYGDADITKNLYVDGDSTLNNVKASSVHVGTNTTPYIDINSDTIEFTGQNSGVQIKHDGNGNIVVSEGNSNAKITGLLEPTNPYDAANKKYIDVNVAELNGRINNLIIGGDSTEGNEIIVYKSKGVHIDNGSASFLFTMQGNNRKLISVEWSAVPTIVGEAYNWRTDNLSITSDSHDSTYFTVLLENIESTDYSYVNFRIVYSRAANLIVPELVDLRQPFNYTGTWPPAEYDPNSQGYVYGNYVTYNDVIYMCIDEQGLVSGQWNPNFWTPVTARLNIQEALNRRLRLGGQDTMQWNLKMGNNRVTGVATPINGTDAATKSYVDNKGFTLDSNGILSFG